MIAHIDKVIRHLRSQIEAADKIDSEFVYITRREAEACLELAEAQDVIQETFAEQETKWVKASDKLPTVPDHYYTMSGKMVKQEEGRVDVIVCDDRGQVFSLFYARRIRRGKVVHRWEYRGYEVYSGNVIAWMPLPAPIKAAKDG